MKYLFIFRHADTLPAFPGQSDYDRALSPRGEDECRRVGSFLQINDIQPKFALCSSAVRTRSTWQLTLEAMGQTVETRHEDGLYLASAGDIFQFANGLNDEINEALILAHNPGVHTFCQILAKSGDRLGRNELASRFPPATLALFRLDIRHWSALSPETNGELLGIAIPKQNP